MLLHYAILTLSSLYLILSVRKLYKSHLRVLRIIYRFLSLFSIIIICSIFILLTDLVIADLLKSPSTRFLSHFQNCYLLPLLKRVFPDLAYILIVITFYILSATVVDTLVYDSVECYIKNYESKPQKIIYMCFNILSQVLLLSIGYLSLFVSMIKLTTWENFMWDDSGLLLVVSNILAGAIKFPKRANTRWNDIVINSYSIFFSLKIWIWGIRRWFLDDSS